MGEGGGGGHGNDGGRAWAAGAACSQGLGRLPRDTWSAHAPVQTKCVNRPPTGPLQVCLPLSWVGRGSHTWGAWRPFLGQGTGFWVCEWEIWLPGRPLESLTVPGAEGPEGVGMGPS